MLLYEKEIPSSFQAIHEAVCDVEEALTIHESWLDSSQRFNTLFILREVLNNAAEHGNHFQSDKKIRLTLHIEARKIMIEVIDEGEGIVLPQQSFDTNDQDILLRTRNRGYPLLSQLATSMSIIDKKVIILLDYSQEEQ